MKKVLRRLAPKYHGKKKKPQLKWKEISHPPSTLLCTFKNYFSKRMNEKIIENQTI